MLISTKDSLQKLIIQKQDTFYVVSNYNLFLNNNTEYIIHWVLLFLFRTLI